MKQPALANRRLHDLNPLVVGEEACKSAHRFGPAVRPYTLIHFVSAGCGTLYKGGKSYHIHAGEAFIILPGEITTYQADRDTPWVYHWIGFDGAMSRRFGDLPSVIPFTTNWAHKILTEYEEDRMGEYRIAGDLFRMYAEFFASRSHTNHYVRRVKDFIRAAYMQNIRVEQIAETMNLDRRYLSRLFKEKTGQSVKEYLSAVRMEEAKRYLKTGVSVTECAHLTGYGDVCNFSKMFKKHTGISPRRFKEENSPSPDVSKM